MTDTPRPGQLVAADELLGRPEVVAPALLGCWVVTDRPEGTTAVRLTEVEAYSGAGDDPAAHSHRGPTPRSAVMFGPPGYLYVYFSYGMHWCANVVVGPEGHGSAVLLRAGEVVDGLDTARSRRPAERSLRTLASGPARLAAVLGWGTGDAARAANTGDLCAVGGPAAVWAGAAGAVDVAAGPRVGVAADADVPLRFWITGDPTVSAYRARVPRTRVRGAG